VGPRAVLDAVVCLGFIYVMLQVIVLEVGKDVETNTNIQQYEKRKCK
jgi:hypothetical protein